MVMDRQHGTSRGGGSHFLLEKQAMKFKRQDVVADRLQMQAMDALDALQAKHWKKLEKVWASARRDMREFIFDIYASYFGHDRWDLARAHSSGAWSHLAEGLRGCMETVNAETKQIAKDAVNDLYKQSLLRHAWVLDQTTPPSFKVRIPHKKKFMESAARSAISYYSGAQATERLGERWNAWSDGYYTNLMTNLKLGALNGSSAHDAVDEIDATKANTPSFGLLDAYQRLFNFETANAINQAALAVNDENPAAEVEEIWETQRDLNVCDDCDDNEGKTEEDVDDEIPLHPNCHCYWRIVPKAWAEMLRDGDPYDYALAVDMDANDLVPNAMAIRNEAGKLAGYTTVDFGSWKAENFHAVSAE